MIRDYFKKVEALEHGSELELDEVIEQLAFNEQGLIPVITQDASSKEILMMAWMNKTSLRLTIETQKVSYWSRSRQQIWVKGETSGHTQQLVSMSFDCDGDAILCQVTQVGAACHTGRPDCFFLDVDADRKKVVIKGSATL